MPELAKKVTLDLARNRLFINGEEFPWHISEEGPVLNDVMARNALRSVSITFYAEDIEVIPAKSVAVEAAELRIEHAQRALADAEANVRDASLRLQMAHGELAAAKSGE